MSELEQLRAEVERLKKHIKNEELSKRLPLRPKCPDCGVESLTGNVHDEECFKWLELKETAESYKAKLVEVHRLVRNQYTTDSNVRDQVIQSIQELIGDER